MEYRLELPQPSADAAAVAAVIEREDASAIVEFDAAGRVWRLSTTLDPSNLLDVLNRAGLPVARGQLSLLPSVCCGGCGG